jgi:general secretion pathway protein A
MLSNLETAEAKLLQIILVGQPQLRRKLDSKDLLQLRQRISIRFHLHPLSYDEVISYISHRLKVAGGTPNLRFDSRALDLIYNYSGGVPRLVNMLCDRALLACYVHGTHTVSKKAVKASINELEGEPELTAAASA